MFKVKDSLFLCLFLHIFMNSSGIDPVAGKETLEKIINMIEKKQGGAYIRFSTSDGKMLQGWNSKNKKIMELKDSFLAYEDSILSGIPIFTYFGIGILAEEIRKKSVLIYSPIDCLFASSNHLNDCINFLKFIKKNNCCMAISNVNISQDKVKLLFGENCRLIQSGCNQDAYNNIDDLEKQCLSNINNEGEYKIIVVALGDIGKILIKRLYKKLNNVFFIDFNVLMEALCGLETSTLMKKNTNFDGQKFVEKVSSKIRVLCTTALIGENFESRKVEYIRTFEKILQLGYEPYIVEACKVVGPTFLETYSKFVVYSNVNDSRLWNKGINEARSISAFFKKCDFNDNDIVIKLTGRYCLENDFFVRLVENNPNVDAFVKIFVGPHERLWGFSGCFAMRYKYFKEMLANFDFGKWQNPNISVVDSITMEDALLIYVNDLQRRGRNILCVDKLYLSFGDGGSSYDSKNFRVM